MKLRKDLEEQDESPQGDGSTVRTRTLQKRIRAPDQRTIVIDNGSGTMKGGFAGEDEPRATFDTKVGRRCPQRLLTIEEDSDDVCLAEQQRWSCSHDGFNMLCPIQNGMITDWDAMEKLWDHMFHSGLEAAPSQHAVVMTEPPLIPKQQREQIVRILFDSFHVPALFLQSQAALSLSATSRSTGVVLELGEGFCHCVPIFQGFTLPHAVTRVNVGGKQLSERMGDLLLDRGCTFSTDADLDWLRELKEHHCFVAYDLQLELQRAAKPSLHRSARLPSGRSISISAERFLCPEALFDPPLAGADGPGIHVQTVAAINKCDPDLTSTLFSNIILSGGSSLFPGLAQRLQRQVRALAPAGVPVTIIAPAGRQYAAWVGGSVVASLKGSGSAWITRQEYDDCGPAIVHRRCF